MSNCKHNIIQCWGCHKDFSELPADIVELQNALKQAMTFIECSNGERGENMGSCCHPAEWKTWKHLVERKYGE